MHRKSQVCAAKDGAFYADALRLDDSVLELCHRVEMAQNIYAETETPAVTDSIECKRGLF